MARSVSIPGGAQVVVYMHMEIEDGPFAQDDFEDYVEGLRRLIVGRYPSFRETEEWLGREDRAILENGHAFVTVSEYMGLVSVCLVPKEPYYSWETDALALAWVDRVESGFRKVLNEHFTTLVRVATFSNGEAVFREAAA